jgi:hypothetical protein
MGLCFDKMSLEGGNGFRIELGEISGGNSRVLTPEPSRERGLLFNQGTYLQVTGPDFKLP